MEKKNKKPQVFQVVGENEIEDNVAQSSAMIQKAKNKIEQSINQVNDSFAADCINVLQKL